MVIIQFQWGGEMNISFVIMTFRITGHCPVARNDQSNKMSNDN